MVELFTKKVPDGACTVVLIKSSIYEVQYYSIIGTVLGCCVMMFFEKRHVADVPR